MIYLCSICALQCSCALPVLCCRTGRLLCSCVPTCSSAFSVLSFVLLSSCGPIELVSRSMKRALSLVPKLSYCYYQSTTLQVHQEHQILGCPIRKRTQTAVQIGLCAWWIERAVTANSGSSALGALLERFVMLKHSMHLFVLAIAFVTIEDSHPHLVGCLAAATAAATTNAFVSRHLLLLLAGAASSSIALTSVAGGSWI
jgi:hypothetical protein